jgi:hypothetical protein
MPRNDPVELSVAFIRATDEAVLITEDGDLEVWLPRSQLTTDSDIDHLSDGEVFEVSVPEWLAYEKGLI